MKNILKTTLAILILAAPMSEAMAQGWNNNRDRHDDRRGAMTMRHDNGHHRGWYKGGRIDRRDWNRGYRVSDWRRYHLQRPPRGYEWRRVDNQYVLAAAATGLIAALVLANQ
ncbi:MAG TPA: RcnB family protein [Rhizomicrobium sp.]|jgi:Ni/Co efflux regulator RcnB|nr:RcnB family protein [Rhizomicrobium sp.]